ncbi:MULTISPECIES: Rz1-like lysis system protein LysC [Burkholderia cepacia complex]|uniref:Rz1-like lysis system protein LysC n=1 Tax=Burkholderia cepacia complex TaxID=87882 RepID=UPI001E301F86|nr:MULTISPECIES: Rz1-like lysis system protein LysC [Burkholderia cepacia complex]
MPACKQALISPAPVITFNACQPVTPCALRAMAPRTNRDMDAALTMTKAAWAQCAATVDAIADCQARAGRAATDADPGAAR